MPKTRSLPYLYARGRHKTATARVRLFSSPSVPQREDSVQLLINGRPAAEYLPGELAAARYRSPFILTKTLSSLSASVKVEGSGVSGQLSAVVHGLARALAAKDPNYRQILKQAGFLTRDPRAKERRKAGHGGKARRSKQSPKR